MPETSRREKIEAMLADDPNDSFLRYSLAMELEKEDRHEDSLKYFQGLMQEDPPYVPSFLMAGQQLARLERIEEAREVLRSGIEVARVQGDSHAAGEMGELLAELGNLPE